MYASVLLLDTNTQPSPVIGSEPRYHVNHGRQRVLRAVVNQIEFTFSLVGNFEFGCPLWIDYKGKRYVNPGVLNMKEGDPITIIRDGHQKIADGFMDAPQIDFVTGWCIFKCKDTTEDINRTNHGIGTGTGWSDVTVNGGWGKANSVNGTTTSPWGPAVTVKYGADKKNEWHFAYQTFLIRGDQELKMSAIVKLAKGTSKARVITLSKRFLDKPKEYFLATAEIPTDTKVGLWSSEFSLPTIQGEPGRIALIDVAFWSPVVGGRRNACSLRYKLSKRVSDVHVPAGGDSVDLVLKCFRAAFRSAGFGGTALKVGAGLVFADGLGIAVDDQGTYGSHIGSFSSTTEWRWIPELATVQVGGTGDVATLQQRIRVSRNPNGRAVAVGLEGASKGVAKRLTLSGAEGNRSFNYTYVIPGFARGWDAVATSPDGLDPVDYAAQAISEVSQAGRPLSVVFQPPTNGRTSGDWLSVFYAHLKPGDYLPTELDDVGPFNQENTVQRVTKLVLFPSKGDALEGTLEPIT